MRSAPSSLRTLLVLLVLFVGPVQAQISVTCEMMERLVAEDCCCASPVDAAHISLVQVLEDHETCCDAQVEIELDSETRREAPALKPGHLPSDVDPPLLLLVAVHSFLSPPPSAPVSHSNAIHTAAVSHVYLLTQRIRI